MLYYAVVYIYIYIIIFTIILKKYVYIQYTIYTIYYTTNCILILYICAGHGGLIILFVRMQHET